MWDCWQIQWWALSAKKMWHTGTVISYLLMLEYQCPVEAISMICVTVKSYYCNYFKVKILFTWISAYFDDWKCLYLSFRKSTVALRGRVLHMQANKTRCACVEQWTVLLWLKVAKNEMDLVFVSSFWGCNINFGVSARFKQGSNRKRLCTTREARLIKLVKLARQADCNNEDRWERFLQAVSNTRDKWKWTLSGNHYWLMLRRNS